jgi:L-ribulose-5-phosphate 3-epimerase
MAKLGMFSWFSYSLPIEERLQMIKRAGFDATSLWWGDEDKNLQPEMARKIGLQIDNIHTPFNHPNDLWLDGLDGEDYLNMLISCVNDCAQHSIPVAVVHITGFSKPPEITRIGIDRVKRLVDLAENKDIYLAFENLNFLQHLDYIFENIKSDHLGFCYDSGHENCFHQDADCLSHYGKRLFAIHIDDNFGDGDTHLLPYDGTVNWNSVKEKLKKCKGIDYLTLEVDFNPKHEKSQIYKGLPAEDFLALAYERVLKLR